MRIPPEAFFKDVDRPVIARGANYPDGYVSGPHRHRCDQLLYGARGVVMATTPLGTWVMPPQRGMWIPAGVVHNVRMLGAVRTHSLYFEPATTDGMPGHCQVVGISAFMRGLIAEAVQLPAEYDVGGRAGALMTLIRHEMRRLPHLPLSLPFPVHKALARRCREFLRRPAVHETIDAWSGETGLSFMAWRQQACLVAALPRLAAGESVTSIAIALGYDNPAAFTSMFKRSLGAPPRMYLRRGL